MNLKYRTFNKRVRLSEDTNTPAGILRDLAKDEDYSVRYCVAKNPNTHIDVLRDLVKDESWGVRQAVARNPKVSSTILVMLFEYEKSLKDPSWSIIMGLYENKKLPEFAKRVIETLFGEVLS